MSGRDVGASVRQRLLNQSRSRAGRFRNSSSISRWSGSCIDWRSLHSRIDLSSRVRFCSRPGGRQSPGQPSTSTSPDGQVTSWTTSQNWSAVCATQWRNRTALDSTARRSRLVESRRTRTMKAFESSFTRFWRKREFLCRSIWLRGYCCSGPNHG